VPETYLDARTQGIGEVIRSRRLFHVPDHQRDFAWTNDEVEQLFSDLGRAIQDDASEYFLGLIVLVAPGDDDAWQILDGQQRLATTTMLYAATRTWLHERGLDTDAHDIQREYIGYRSLGEAEDLSRLTLNITNRPLFEKYVVGEAPMAQIQDSIDSTGRYSSERRLLEAALRCRTLVAEYASEAGEDEQAQARHLYEFANYLRDKARVVVMNVPSTTNAYVIFEALNDRGLDLSVLDLVKNHLFGKAGRKLTQVQSSWAAMVANLGDRPADDFLKVWWTSQHGRIQRGRLFHEWRERYDSLSEREATELACELAQGADQFSALDTADHDVWDGYTPSTRRFIGELALLGNRQLRPIMMAALRDFTVARMERLLELLVIMVVRYQTIGKGRTGLLEIAAARAARQMADGRLNTPKKVWFSLSPLLEDDERFRASAEDYAETKAARARYILAELERTVHLDSRDDASVELVPWDGLTLEHVLPRSPGSDWHSTVADDPDLVTRTNHLGNLCLLSERPNRAVGNAGFARKCQEIYSNSQLILTSTIAVEHSVWTRSDIAARQARLADLVVRTWPKAY